MTPQTDLPLVIGHRGALPETDHTFASYQLAIDSGADAIETDICLLRDGSLIATHDSQLRHWIQQGNPRVYTLAQVKAEFDDILELHEIVDFVAQQRVETGRDIELWVNYKDTFDTSSGSKARFGEVLVDRLVSLGMSTAEEVTFFGANQEVAAGINSRAAELGVAFTMGLTANLTANEYNMEKFIKTLPDGIDYIGVRGLDTLGKDSSHLNDESAMDFASMYGFDEMYYWTIQQQNGVSREWAEEGVDILVTNYAGFTRKAVDAHYGMQTRFGSNADQTIVLGDADDKIYAQGGSDTVQAAAGDDWVFGDAGDDFIFGGAGADFLNGGGGADHLVGDSGADILFGGAGNDVLVTDAADTLVFEAGDGIDYVTAPAGIVVRFADLGRDAYVLRRSGDNIIVQATEGGDAVILAGAASGGNQPVAIIFADGQSMTAADLLVAVDAPSGEIATALAALESRAAAASSHDKTVDFTLNLGAAPSGAVGRDTGDPELDVVTASFLSIGQTMTLTLDTRDIDANDEVAIYLNGQAIGHLVETGSGLQGTQRIVLPAALQTAGENRIDFYSAGSDWIWELDALSLSAGPDYALSVNQGTVDTTVFGDRPAGSSATGDPIGAVSNAQGMISFGFQGAGETLVLRLDTHDIDTSKEVEIRLNGQSLGWMSATGSGADALQSIIIPAALQVIGENTLSLHQTGLDHIWSVANVTLTSDTDLALTAGQIATIDGTETRIVASGGAITTTFASPAGSAWLTFDSLDISAGDTIRAVVNGTVLVEKISQGAGLSIFIDAALLSSGENTLSFEGADPNGTWALDNVTLHDGPHVVLSAGQIVTDSFGYDSLDPDVQHVADGRIVAEFIGGTEDLRLRFEAESITEAVEVWLNGGLIGTLETGNTGSVSSHVFHIAAENQLTGTNRVEFRNPESGDTWSISELRIDPGADFDMSDPASAAALRIGSSYANAIIAEDAEITIGFVGNGENRILSLETYDIDGLEEVEVFLNGSSLGYLRQSGDGAQVVQDIMLATDLQVTGDNVVTLKQDLRQNHWGVTNVTLSESGDVTALVVDDTVARTVAQNPAQGAQVDQVAHGVILATFEATGQSMMMQVDMDNSAGSGTVEAFLNGVSLGRLRAPASGDSVEFLLPAVAQTEGTNTLLFRHDSLEATWSLSNFTLDTQLHYELAASDPTGSAPEMAYDSQTFGANYLNRIDTAAFQDAQEVTGGFVAMRFVGTGTTMRLGFDAFDIDNPQEVDVYLNGTKLSTLFETGSDTWHRQELVLPASHLSAEENIVEFRQTDLANIWAITNVDLHSGGHFDLSPSADEANRDDRLFNDGGHGEAQLNGEIGFVFAGTGKAMQLSFEAWDIDQDDEVEVFVNGQAMGHLLATGNISAAMQTVVLPAALLVDGDNTVVFRQTGLDHHWRISDVLLSEGADYMLEAGEVADATAQGHGGSTDMIEAEGQISFAFDAYDELVTLSFDAWDIDTGSEVSIALNGSPIGWLKETIGTGAHQQIVLRNSQLVEGENTITLSQTGLDHHWEVEDVLLKLGADVALDWAAAPVFSGGLADHQKSVVSAEFDTLGRSALLSFDAYDVDYDGELRVFANGKMIGELQANGQNDWSTYTVLVPADVQAVGETIITVEQDKAGNNWNVRNFMLRDDMHLDLNVAMPAGDRVGTASNVEVETSNDMVGAFFDVVQPGDQRLCFSVQTYAQSSPIDIFDISLNGQHLGMSSDFQISGGQSNAQFEVPVSMYDQHIGRNEIILTHVTGDDDIWAVTQMSIEPVVDII